MRARTLGFLSMAACLVALAAGSVQAQTRQTHPTPSARLHNFLHARQHPKAATASAGAIIGNKNTKVYHLPGDTGMLPQEKNRVYFKTEAEAQAAGYHAAGSRHTAKTHARHVPARDAKTGRFHSGAPRQTPPGGH